MALKFLPVIVAVFIINFGTAFTADHDDCFMYDAEAPNGKLIKEIYHECGVIDAETFNNPKLFKCIVDAFQVVNEDGTFDGEKMKTLMKEYAYPEYFDEIRDLVDELLKQPPENFYTLFPKGLAKICPNDQFNQIF